MKTGVSYYGNIFLNHFKRDLKKIVSFCDFIVFTFSEEDLKFHKNSFKRIIDVTKKENIEIWIDPWGVGGVFGGEAFSEFLIYNRNSLQILSSGIEIPMACLNNPSFLNYFQKWIDKAAEFNPDYIFFDEPHIFIDRKLENDGIFSCFCNFCQNEFSNLFNETMPQKFNQKIRAFQIKTIINFLTKISLYSKSKNLKTAITIYAIEDPDYEKFWEEVAKIQSLDVFGCDPYWRMREIRSFDFVERFIKKTQDTSKKYSKKSLIWIQAMNFPQKTESEIIKVIEILKRYEIDFVAAWSYDGGEILDNVKSDNPQKIQKILKNEFSKLK